MSENQIEESWPVTNRNSRSVSFFRSARSVLSALAFVALLPSAAWAEPKAGTSCKIPKSATQRDQPAKLPGGNKVLLILYTVRMKPIRTTSLPTW